MPLLRKLIKVGHSRAVILPYAWLKYYEKLGLSIEEVLMEVDGEITIRVPTQAERKLFIKQAEIKNLEVAER